MWKARSAENSGGREGKGRQKDAILDARYLALSFFSSCSPRLDLPGTKGFIEMNRERERGALLPRFSTIIHDDPSVAQGSGKRKVEKLQSPNKHPGLQ